MENQYKKVLVVDEKSDVVWDFLTKPEYTKKYMYNSVIVSSWKEGESFSWLGEYLGEKVETEGTLVKYIPKSYFQFSELKDGKLDEIVSYQLESISDNQTKVTLIADYYGDDFPGYIQGWDEIVIKNFLTLSQ